MKNFTGCYFFLIFSTLCLWFCTDNPVDQRVIAANALHTSSPDSCDSPDSPIRCSFAQMPLQLSFIMQIAGTEEPGERLVIRGKILKSDGITPVSGAKLYGYQTNAKGIYAKKGGEEGVLRWHGHLHGWCETDAEGRYEIHTIRPARYPSNTMPAHIHPIIWIEGSEPFYLTDFVFSDDDLVDNKYLNSLHQIAGGTGIVSLKKNADNVWEGERTILLKR